MVCKKADSIYPIVSAASICAKVLSLPLTSTILPIYCIPPPHSRRMHQQVTRDVDLLNWTFKEQVRRVVFVRRPFSPR